MTKILKKFGWSTAILGLALATMVLPIRAVAQDQDQQDDPPSRVARIGYIEGSVSFQPAGERDWVQAVANRPMTTGDKLWADKGSRAELQMGSAVIRLDANTGFSFLNLDDETVQIELTSGAVNLRVRRLDQNDVFEIDTPNLAFSVTQPGSYRVEASEDGTYTVVSIREGGGESTGNGQTYTLHEGQRGTFSGTESLNAEVTDIGGPDQFDNWAYGRDHHYDESRSAQYLSHDVVGYEDLDDYGDWRDDSNYGHVWYPTRVAAGWAPYREGHWEWIPPWGYTWVDDSPWGYAPFHYGRWVVVGGRWGWVAGPAAARPVYAPALVIFIGGGGVGVGFGGNVGWFPLGPREVYVPSYHVSREYMNRVNISNTTVNNVQITNVYNTTIVNKTTNITNMTYVNRNVRGAVTAVPQRAFASAQPVARAAVAVNERQIATASVSTRLAVAPTRESVLGARAATAGRVTAPPAAVMNRQVIAKRTPPPPPVPFAKQQQALEAHPGQPLARSEVRNLRPATTEAAHPTVKQAPPGKPATANVARPDNQPGNQPNAARPGQPASTRPANRPGNRPDDQQAPNERPDSANPPKPNQPSNRRAIDRPPTEPTNSRPNQLEERRPGEAPSKNDRPPSVPAKDRPDTNPPNNRPETSRSPAAEPNQSAPNDRRETNRQGERPARVDRPSGAQPNNRPEHNRPELNRNQSAPAKETRSPSDRPQQNTGPAETKPEPPTQGGQAKQQTREEKKQEQERQKREEQKHKEKKQEDQRQGEQKPPSE